MNEIFALVGGNFIAAFCCSETAFAFAPPLRLQSPPSFAIMAAAKPKVVDQDKIDEDHIFDAVIIGAGWAGLAAATTLKKKGCDNICILEARDYIGGRSITSYELGVPLDLGSSWIHGRSKNHPLQRLIKEFNLPAAKCGGEGNWR